MLFVTPKAAPQTLTYYKPSPLTCGTSAWPLQLLSQVERELCCMCCDRATVEKTLSATTSSPYASKMSHNSTFLPGIKIMSLPRKELSLSDRKVWSIRFLYLSLLSFLRICMLIVAAHSREIYSCLSYTVILLTNEEHTVPLETLESTMDGLATYRGSSY